MVGSAHLLLHGAKEAAQARRPRAAGYGLVGILDLGVEVVGRLLVRAVPACLLFRGVLRVALLLNMVICRVHGSRVQVKQVVSTINYRLSTVDGRLLTANLSRRRRQPGRIQGPRRRGGCARAARTARRNQHPPG
jgi:hypothetical protein